MQKLLINVQKLLIHMQNLLIHLHQQVTLMQKLLMYVDQ